MRCPNESRPAVWIGRIKPELTLLNQPKTPKLPPASTRLTRKKVPLPYALSLGLPFWTSKGPHRPPGRGAKPIDQGLGAVQRREPGLNIAQPGEVLLARLRSQGLLGVFELLM